MAGRMLRSMEVAAQPLWEQWRVAADHLDAYARCCRRDGDPREAEAAEAAAMDYRIAADEMEARA